jgi:phosphatidylserine decarboxylase
MNLTPYGRPQTTVIIAIVVIVAALAAVFCQAPIMAVCTILVIGVAILGFFRDPMRNIPADKNVLVSPADGKVTDITELDDHEFFGGPVTRIGIFLSVFNVHINRVPCAGRVTWKFEKPGLCLNALKSELASQKNQSCSIGLDCPAHPAGKVVVKQITGAIARRIVCDCQEGNELIAGQRYGMIKFGSRTELFIPRNSKAQITVKPGDKVKAGETVMVRY